MVTYEVAYRPIGSRRWTLIKGIKGDGFVILNEKLSGGGAFISDMKTRWFILDDETRIEVPTEGVEFRFSKERHLRVIEKMEQESGQTLKTDPR